MNRISMMAMGCALALLAAGPATAADFSGVWYMSEGHATLVQSGAELTGTYARDGQIAGTVTGEHFSGYWAEAGSAEPCASDKLGSKYWGRLEWDLAPGGKSFAGQWSYCDKDVGGHWTGLRVGDDVPPDGPKPPLDGAG